MPRSRLKGGGKTSETGAVITHYLVDRSVWEKKRSQKKFGIGEQKVKACPIKKAQRRKRASDAGKAENIIKKSKARNVERGKDDTSQTGCVLYVGGGGGSRVHRKGMRCPPRGKSS